MKLDCFPTGCSSSSLRSNPSKLVKEELVVGFDEEVRRVIEKLDDGGEGKPLEIIRIFGAAGGGKTTLAVEVYRHPLTTHIFEIRAWVDVSQEYDRDTMKRDLLIRILKSASPQNHGDYEKSSEDKLGEDVHKCLKGNKYLIVMDDIWGIEAWNDIQRSFPKERKGSKILFTSRLGVQSDNIGCVPHCLAPLSKSSSLELLEKKVFGMKRCPPELVGIGKCIAKKCEGLPLMIVAIAGIIAKEATLDVWEEVVKHLSSVIAKNQGGCMEILELSYNYLPLFLKQCFMYIGAFPEDYRIPVRELIWLWIAEGFIQPSEGEESLEAIANNYIIDLIDRSLLMMARKNSSGEIKACRIHDLLRELCLKKAKEDNFFVKLYEDGSFSPSAALSKHPRIFIRCEFFDKFSLSPHARNLHSFMCLCKRNCSCSSADPNMSFLAENFELLRVLSFIPAAECRANMGRLDFVLALMAHMLSVLLSAVHWKLPEPSTYPRNLANLVHLRYLEYTLRADHWMLPTPFAYPLSLEILKVQAPQRGTEFIQLPLDVFNMVNLRHIYSRTGVFAYHVSSQGGSLQSSCEPSSNLDSLQTLHRICSCDNCRSFLERTPNLKTLGVEVAEVSKDGVLNITPNLEFLECLETLKFTMSRHCNRLPNRTFPSGLKLPPTVTRLTLSNVKIKWEELSILQTLPRLEVLKLLNSACTGSVWNTSEEGFSQLKYLKLEQLGLNEWNASDDQFQRLEVLVIEGCPDLERIPINFANLYELREINLHFCSMSAARSALNIQKEQRNTNGDDGCLDIHAKFIYPPPWPGSCGIHDTVDFLASYESLKKELRAASRIGTPW